MCVCVDMRCRCNASSQCQVKEIDNRGSHYWVARYSARRKTESKRRAVRMLERLHENLSLQAGAQTCIDELSALRALFEIPTSKKSARSSRLCAEVTGLRSWPPRMKRRGSRQPSPTWPSSSRLFRDDDCDLLGSSAAIQLAAPALLPHSLFSHAGCKEMWPTFARRLCCCRRRKLPSLQT